MLQLIYCSVATKAFSSDDLHGLLDQSRDNNIRHGITGILVYENGVFLQVIEGPSDAIQRLKSNIEGDRRHHSFRQLHCAEISSREFGDWSMAFAAPNPGVCTVEGFIDLGTESMVTGLSSSKAQQMLTMFQEGILNPSPATEGSQGACTVSFAPAPKTTEARLNAESSRAYLTQLAHAIALSMPDVGVCVEIAPGDLISYNVHRDLMRGEAELF